MYGQGLPKPKPVATPATDDDREVSLDEWDDIVADHYRVPKNLMKSMAGQESGGDIKAVSPTGVRGRYQVTEQVAKGYGLDRNNPFQQSVAAARYLREQYEALKEVQDDDERWLGAVGRYYGGPAAVRNGELSTASVDDLSNPADHVRKVAEKWGTLNRGQAGTAAPQSSAQAPPTTGTLEKPANRPVRPKPLTSNEQRNKQAAQIIKSIEASRNAAVQLFQEADSAIGQHASGVSNAQYLRARAEGALDQANRLAKYAQKDYADLIEAGFGDDTNPTTNRKWAYAKPRSGDLRMFMTPTAEERVGQMATNRQMARRPVSIGELPQSRDPRLMSPEGRQTASDQFLRSLAIDKARAEEALRGAIEKEAQDAPESTIGRMGSRFGRGVVRGVKGGMQAPLISSRSPLSAQVREQIGREYEDFGKEYFPIDERNPALVNPLRSEFWNSENLGRVITQTLPEALGSMIPYMLLGRGVGLGSRLAGGTAALEMGEAGALKLAEVATPKALQRLGIKSMGDLASSAGSSGLGALQGVTQGYEAAKAAGLGEDAARKSGAIEGIIGMLEGLGSPAMRGTFMKTALREIPDGAREEFIQEAWSQLLQGFNAAYLTGYDKNKGLRDIVGEALGAGAVGGVLGGLGATPGAIAGLRSGNAGAAAAPVDPTSPQTPLSPQGTAPGAGPVATPSTAAPGKPSLATGADLLAELSRIASPAAAAAAKPTLDEEISRLETEGESLSAYAMQNAAADPETASQSLNQALGRYGKAIKTLEASPEYQNELIAIARGEQLEATPYRDRVTQLKNAQAQLENFATQQKQAEVEQQRAEKLAQVEAEKQGKEAEAQAKRAEIEQQRALKAQERAEQQAAENERRQQLADEAMRVADESAARIDQLIEQGDTPNAIGELRARQQTLRSALKYLPETAEGIRRRAEIIRQIEAINPRISDLKRRGAEQARPQAAPKATPLLESVVNPEGGNPQLESVYEPGARFLRLAEQSPDLQEETPNLLTAIRRAGGIRSDGDTTGELRRLGLKEGGTTGLLNNKSGVAIDRMREMMVSEGLSRAETVAEFYDEIEQEMRAAQNRKGRVDDDLSAYYENLPEDEELPEPPARIVRVGDEEVELTPEQAARWETEVDEPLRESEERYRRDMASPNPRTREEAERRRKADAMRIAAKKREIADRLTGKEQAARAAAPVAEPSPANAPAPAAEPAGSFMSEFMDDLDPEDAAALRGALGRYASDNPREYSDRTRPGEPGSGGVSFSPFSVLVANNRQQVNELFGLDLRSDEAIGIIDGLREYAVRNDIDLHHLQNLLNAIRNEQLKEARFSDQGLSYDEIQGADLQDTIDFLEMNESQTDEELRRLLDSNPKIVDQLLGLDPQSEEAAGLVESLREYAIRNDIDLRHLHDLLDEVRDYRLERARIRNQSLSQKQIDEIQVYLDSINALDAAGSKANEELAAIAKDADAESLNWIRNEGRELDDLLVTLHEDADMMELFEAAVAGSEESFAAFEEGAVNEYGYSAETARYLVESRRTAERNRPSASTPPAQERADRVNQERQAYRGNREGAGQIQPEARLNAEDLDLLSRNLTSIPDAELDDHLGAVENLRNLGIRGPFFGGKLLEPAEERQIRAVLNNVNDERTLRRDADTVIKRLGTAEAIQAEYAKLEAERKQIGRKKREADAPEIEKLDYRLQVHRTALARLGTDQVGTLGPKNTPGRVPTAAEREERRQLDEATRGLPEEERRRLKAELRARQNEESGGVSAPRKNKQQLADAMRDQATKEQTPTLTHPDPALDQQPILAERADGRVVIANPENKSGISIVKDRSGEETEHKFSSTQVNLPKELADRVREFASRIPDADLAENGREDEPHVTIKYGLHGSRAGSVREILEGAGRIKAKLGRISLFTDNPDFDVVKIEVESKDLHRLNEALAEGVPNTEKFPDYNPHVTLAYVKKGHGDKYVGNRSFLGQNVEFDQVKFSGREGNQENIRVAESAEEAPKAAARAWAPIPADAKLELMKTPIRDPRSGFTGVYAGVSRGTRNTLLMLTPEGDQVEVSRDRAQWQAEQPAGRTATEAAKDAVKETGKGLDSALKGLSDLFGGSKLSAGFTFDEDTYAAAKPHFQEAYGHFKQAVQSASDVAGLLIAELRKRGFADEIIRKMRPYIARFAREEGGAERERAAARALSEKIGKQIGKDLLDDPSIFDEHPTRAELEKYVTDRLNDDETTERLTKLGRQQVDEPEYLRLVDFEGLWALNRKVDAIYKAAERSGRPEDRAQINELYREYSQGVQKILTSPDSSLTEQLAAQQVRKSILPELNDTGMSTLEEFASKAELKNWLLPDYEDNATIVRWARRRIDREALLDAALNTPAVRAAEAKQRKSQRDAQLAELEARRRDLTGLRERVPAEDRPLFDREIARIDVRMAGLKEQTAGGEAAKPKFVADAEQRLRDAATGKLAGAGFEQMADIAIVTGYRIYRKGMTYAQWAKAMVKELGEDIRPHLKKAWDSGFKDFEEALWKTRFLEDWQYRHYGDLVEKSESIDQEIASFQARIDELKRRRATVDARAENAYSDSALFRLQAETAAKFRIGRKVYEPGITFERWREAAEKAAKKRDLEEGLFSRELYNQIANENLNSPEPLNVSKGRPTDRLQAVNEGLSASQKKLTDLQSEDQALTDQIKDLEERLSEIDDERENLEERFTRPRDEDAEDEVDEFLTKEQYKAARTELATQLKSVKADLRRLERQSGRLSQSIEDATADVDTFKTIREGEAWRAATPEERRQMLMDRLMGKDDSEIPYRQADNGDWYLAYWDKYPAYTAADIEAAIQDPMHWSQSFDPEEVGSDVIAWAKKNGFDLTSAAEPANAPDNPPSWSYFGTPRVEKLPETKEEAHELIGNIRSEFRPKSDSAGTVWVNHQATMAISSAAQELKIEFGSASGWIGVSMSLRSTRRIMDFLRQAAEDYGSAGARLSELAENMREGLFDAYANGKAGIVFAEPAGSKNELKKTLREERFHQWQQSNDLLNPLITGALHVALRGDPVYDHIVEQLVMNEGYLDRPTVLAVEVPAKIASGQWTAYNLESAEQGDNLLHRYFRAAAQLLGPEVLLIDAPGTARVRGVQQDVRDVLGIEKETAARRGATRQRVQTRNSDGNQSRDPNRLEGRIRGGRGSGSEAAGGRPVPGDRSLSRRTGDRGQAAGARPGAEPARGRARETAPGGSGLGGRASGGRGRGSQTTDDRQNARTQSGDGRTAGGGQRKSVADAARRALGAFSIGPLEGESSGGTILGAGLGSLQAWATQPTRSRSQVSLPVGWNLSKWARNLHDQLQEGVANGKISNKRATKILEAIREVSAADTAGDGIALFLARENLAQLTGEKFSWADVAGAPRSIKAGLDLSFAFRQGGAYNFPGLFLRPIETFRRIGKGFASMREGNYGEVNAQIAARPRFQQMMESGLHLSNQKKLEGNKLTDREEGYIARFMQNVPGYKQSERGNTTLLDLLRADTFDRYASYLDKRGVTFDKNPEAFKQMAKFVNLMTGRGTFGEYDNAIPFLSLAMFSPRWVASRIQLLNMSVNPLAYRKIDPALRRLMWRDLGQYAGALGLTLGMLAAAGAYGLAQIDVGDEPDDPDFGKVVINGKYHYDLTSGLQQYLVFGTRMANAFYRRDYKGEKLRDSQQPSSIALKFLRSKASPAGSLVANVMTGKDYTGQPVSVSSAAADLVYPLLIKDFVEGYNLEGVAGGLASLPATIGVGYGVYEKGGQAAKVPELRAEAEKADVFFGDKRIEGEPPELQQARLARRRQYVEQFGSALVSSNLYRSASAEDKAALLKKFNDVSNALANEKTPDLDKLSPESLMASLEKGRRQSEQNKRRQGERLIYGGQTAPQNLQ